MPSSAKGRVQLSLYAALANADNLRAERDAAVTARDSAETERRLMSDELNRMGAELAAAQSGDQASAPADTAALEAELEACRTALATFTAPASANDQVADTAAIADAAAAAASGAQGLMGTAEPAPAATEGDVDDLQQIKGIGPKIAGILNDLGIRQYAQVAAWTPDNVARINDQLKFKGRVEREGWIEQARGLMQRQGAD